MRFHPFRVARVPASHLGDAPAPRQRPASPRWVSPLPRLSTAPSAAVRGRYGGFRCPLPATRRQAAPCAILCGSGNVDGLDGLKALGVMNATVAEKQARKARHGRDIRPGTRQTVRFLRPRSACPRRHRGVKTPWDRSLQNADQHNLDQGDGHEHDAARRRPSRCCCGPRS